MKARREKPAEPRRNRHYGLRPPRPAPYESAMFPFLLITDRTRMPWRFYGKARSLPVAR